MKIRIVHKKRTYRSAIVVRAPQYPSMPFDFNRIGNLSKLDALNFVISFRVFFKFSKTGKIRLKKICTQNLELMFHDAHRWVAVAK